MGITKFGDAIAVKHESFDFVRTEIVFAIRHQLNHQECDSVYAQDHPEKFRSLYRIFGERYVIYQTIFSRDGFIIHTQVSSSIGELRQYLQFLGVAETRLIIEDLKNRFEQVIQD